MFVLNGEPFVPIGLLALTEPPGPAPTIPVLHDMPLFEPGCPVPVVVNGWGFSANTAPADGSRRQVAKLRVVMMRFMSEALSRLQIGGFCSVRNVKVLGRYGA